MNQRADIPECLNPFFPKAETFHSQKPIQIRAENPSSPRLQYVCNFLFRQILKIPFEITDFNSDSGHAFIIEYGKTSGHSDAIFIPSDGLLYENNIPSVSDKYFFLPDENTLLKKDIFSFIFFHLSRAEEWNIPDDKKDKHKRFEADASLLCKNNLCEVPVIDASVYYFIRLLNQKGWIEVKKNYNAIRKILTVDIDNGFACLGKGIIRTSGSFLRDLIKGNFSEIQKRMAVLTGKQPDPFDVYDIFYEKTREHLVPLYYFVLLSDKKPFNRFLKKNSPYRKKLAEKIRHRCEAIGLHPSYETLNNPELYKKEWEEFSFLFPDFIRPKISRQHYLRFDIRTTPACLIENGVTADFSMGFASRQGFRAGTTYPFLYFNFNKNQQEKLWLVPFSFMDGNYFIYDSIPAEQAKEKMQNLLKTIAYYEGNACLVFHERTLYEGTVKNYKEVLLWFLSY